MAFDYKRAYKEIYAPKATPSVVCVPPMRYLAVRGSGDPNEEGGAYQSAVGVLYALSFTIKMSRKGTHAIEGYFDFVVPPLEGFWWQDGVVGIDYAHKERFEWLSVIRLPDFVGAADVSWAKEEVRRKRHLDASAAFVHNTDEGLCVQCLHTGPYDDEPATVARMHAFLGGTGYELDLSDTRRHHEIYLSDARRVAPERLRTVIRHPIRPRASARDASTHVPTTATATIRKGGERGQAREPLVTRPRTS